MKKQLILALIALALVATVRIASADQEIKVVKNVTKVTLVNKFGAVMFLKEEPEKPFTVIRKNCPADPKRDCLYTVAGRKESKPYDFDPSYQMRYYTQTVVRR